MKIILIGGMEQSGSTLVFNLIQKLYRILGYIVDSCWIVDYHKKDFNEKCDILVVKTHGLDRNITLNAYKIILPIRDIRDAAISASIRFSPSKGKDMPFIMSRMEKNVNIINNWHNFIKQKKLNHFEFMYERFKKNEVAYTAALIDYLNISLDIDNIKEALNEINTLHNSKDIVKKDDFSYQNLQYKKTLLTQNHNTSGGKSKKYMTYFTKEENDNILKNEKVYSFLKAYGYLY